MLASVGTMDEVYLCIHHMYMYAFEFHAHQYKIRLVLAYLKWTMYTIYRIYIFPDYIHRERYLLKHICAHKGATEIFST